MRRRSTEETLDFDDVFGGPPRSVISGRFSGAGGDITRSSLFFEDVFGMRDVRNDGFKYGKDVEDLRRSRSRSKSQTNSSSVLSSEGFSPYRPPVAADDVLFSSFASKLRPINIPSKWNSETMMHEIQPKQQGAPDFPCNRPSFIENRISQNEYIGNFRSCHVGLSRRVPSLETINLDTNSYDSVKVSIDDSELNSPSSEASSLYQDEVSHEHDMEQEEYDIMNSYVIEINSHNSEETCEAIAVDDAIAWAKAKFQAHEKQESAKVEERPSGHQFPVREIGGCGIPLDDKPSIWSTEEEKQQKEKDMEMELLDEDIRLWSVGKEANILQLLSTLHHILWPSSGWHPILLTNLKDSSHVKKAYQKARLCLHPDKLQQRGATLPQKYIADKAFPILQDAWASFISEEISLVRR